MTNKAYRLTVLARELANKSPSRHYKHVSFILNGHGNPIMHAVNGITQSEHSEINVLKRMCKRG